MKRENDKKRNDFKLLLNILGKEKKEITNKITPIEFLFSIRGFLKIINRRTASKKNKTSKWQ